MFGANLETFHLGVLEIRSIRMGQMDGSTAQRNTAVGGHENTFNLCSLSCTIVDHMCAVGCVRKLKS